MQWWDRGMERLAAGLRKTIPGRGGSPYARHRGSLERIRERRRLALAAGHRDVHLHRPSRIAALAAEDRHQTAATTASRRHVRGSR
jgi:hypothetical protein